MLLIVISTGLSGFMFSFLLLLAGVTAMWVRYPLAVGLCYLEFIGLLRLWLGFQVRDYSSPYTPGDAASDLSIFAPEIPDRGILGDAGVADAGSVLDFDEWGFLLVVLLSVVAGFLVCIYLIWTGPVLLAEVLVDGFIMARVYKRMKVKERSYWGSGVLRRTWFVALLAMVSFGIAGFAMHMISPEAVSVGPFLEDVMGRM
ncbi:MAG: hypothetical protein RBU21_22710 [FCB group bacterium]|jgi:hypothetical protein|nr:hypothetical protein [FCB group bacterium]